MSKFTYFPSSPPPSRSPPSTSSRAWPIPSPPLPSNILIVIFCVFSLTPLPPLPRPSSPLQITAEYIFASLATLSEFVVFLYMGMGVFTGRFRDWDWRFIGLAIVFCLVARLFNTFPFSALANLW